MTFIGESPEVRVKRKKDKPAKRHPCWPKTSPDGGLVVGNRIGSECAVCKHIDVLHSTSRGCVACQILAEHPSGDAP